MQVIHKTVRSAVLELRMQLRILGDAAGLCLMLWAAQSNGAIAVCQADGHAPFCGTDPPGMGRALRRGQEDRL